MSARHGPRARAASPKATVCSVLLFASVAAAGLGGCRAEPSEPRSPETEQPAQPWEAAQPAQPEPAAPEALDFAADVYLEHVCRDELGELPFKRFQSYDFVYGSPLPVRVSGAYYEVRGKDAADANTIYQEVVATIFRDVEMVVEAEQTAPHFSFDRWDVPFAVSDHPFSPSRQLQHQRAMGATFPFLDLADFERPDSGGPDFSRSFISALNFLATRGENVWGAANSFEEREKARQIRTAMTATDYEQSLPVEAEDLAALRAIPASEDVSVSRSGYYILISLGKPARFVAAIDTSKDSVGFRACTGERNGATTD
jgi:hypothetical protein